MSHTHFKNENISGFIKSIIEMAKISFLLSTLVLRLDRYSWDHFILVITRAEHLVLPRWAEDMLLFILTPLEWAAAWLSALDSVLVVLLPGPICGEAD